MSASGRLGAAWLKAMVIATAAALLHSCLREPAVRVASEDPPSEVSSGQSRPAALVVDAGAPLLLDEPSPDESPSTKTMADNSSCYVCHVNYQKEQLVTQHAVENIGCAGCHGESTAHKNDENNTTPPDRMFPSDTIDEACRTCHATHDAPAADVIARWQERCPTKTDPKTLLCTDCHGDHRLTIRTVRWDKKTGRLLGQPGVSVRLTSSRAVAQAPSASERKSKQVSSGFSPVLLSLPASHLLPLWLRPGDGLRSVCCKSPRRRRL